MNNLYNSIEIIEILNFVLMISVPFICVALYKVSKELSFLSISLIYVIEIVLWLTAIKYDYVDISKTQKLYI